MKIVSACSSHHDPCTAVSACFAELGTSEMEEISWLGVYCSDPYSVADVVAEIASRSGRAAIHGGTSCMGVMSSEGTGGPAY